MKLPVTVVLDSVRSAYNVGSIFRTCDAVNAERIVLTGLSPHPKLAQSDARPLHVAARAHRQIAKTALGAENTLPFSYYPTLSEAIAQLRRTGHSIYALEQAAGSTSLFEFTPSFPCALVVGHETEGVRDLGSADQILEIPMDGAKESLNVAVAVGLAVYHLRNIK